VDVATDLALKGAVAQYGRGVIADVAGKLTDQFARCIAAKLAASPAGSVTAQPRQQAAPVGGLRLVLGAFWRSLFRRPRR
jgi:hypothetical protein